MAEIQPPNEFDDYLRLTLGIAEANVRTAIQGQGLRSFASFDGVEEDDIKSIAMNIRKPGGLIRRANAMVANPGTEVGFLYVRNLQMLRYYINHCIRIQREVVAAEMTMARLTNVYKLKEVEDKAKEATLDLPEKIIKVEDIRNNIEDLDNYLVRKLGQSGLPLAYVVRDNVGPPFADPGFGLPNVVEEMISRGDHNQPAYQTDNITVWNVIRHMTHGGLAWSWVSAYARTQNGRDAYIALKAHYLGESYQARIKAAADAVLSKTYYDGQRSFSFEQYISTLQKAFTDMESTGEEVAEERKVRILLRGITASSLTTGVGIVMSTPALKTNYEAAVNYLSETNDTLRQAATVRRNVSSVTKSSASSGKGNDKKKKGTHTKSKSGYYKYKDWWNLTDEQRQEIRDKRKSARNNQKIQVVSSGSVTDVSTSSTITSSTNADSTTTPSVGAVMSRRAARGGN